MCEREREREREERGERDRETERQRDRETERERERMRDLDLPQVSSPYKTLAKSCRNTRIIHSRCRKPKTFKRNCQKCYSKKCFIVNATLTIMGLK